MSAALRDVMDALAGIKPGSALDAVRNRRPQAREQAEASFRALFEPESFAGVSATERFALAVFVTGLHGDAVSAGFYAERLAATGPSPEVPAAIDAAIAAATGQGPYGRYPARPLSRDQEESSRTARRSFVDVFSNAIPRAPGRMPVSSRRSITRVRMAA